MAAPYHYGRTQFLGDVAWMGLDPALAFSPKNLRRERDRLMQLHHPDRGGSAEMAARINITYSRMRLWLDGHRRNRNTLRMRRESVLAKAAATNPGKPAGSRAEAIRFYAALLATTTAVLGIGLSSLARRRR